MTYIILPVSLWIPATQITDDRPDFARAVTIFLYIRFLSLTYFTKPLLFKMFSILRKALNMLYRYPNYPVLPERTPEENK